MARYSQPALQLDHHAVPSDAFDDRPTTRMDLVTADLAPGMWARLRRYGCVGLVMRVTESGRVHLTLFAMDGEPTLDWVASVSDLARCDPPSWARKRGSGA